MKLLSLPKLTQQAQFPKIFVLCLLLIFLIFGAVPGYLTGQWSWLRPPNVTNLKQIKNLRSTGLKIPGWETLEHKVQPIGGSKWSIQTIKRDEQTQAIIMFLPLDSHTHQPEVEWMDINGFMNWQTDSTSQLQFDLPLTNLKGETNVAANSAKITGRYFRAWVQQPNFAQTYAVLQWYAWPNGGNPNPFSWFLADRSAQWQRRRLPWVAVNISIAIEPLGDIEKAQSLAQSLAQSVQSALMQTF